MNKPRYPVYIISKGRFENCLTAQCFIRDGVDFTLVVEEQEAEQYASRYGAHRIAVLPFSNLGLGSYPARNWCWENSIERDYGRHWIFDDNIRDFYRAHRGNRFLVNANIALSVAEEFAHRYVNLPLMGFNYKMFVVPDCPKPFFLNCHVYSALLIQNDLPFRWRLRYNEDTDLCLQVLTYRVGGQPQCTVSLNAFSVDKMATMTMKGGNTSQLYKGDGRLKMARSLEEVWPQYVQVKHKFGRPQHHVNWKQHFQQTLIRRSDLDWDNLPPADERGMELKAIKPIVNEKLRAFYERRTHYRPPADNTDKPSD